MHYRLFTAEVCQGAARAGLLCEEGEAGSRGGWCRQFFSRPWHGPTEPNAVLVAESGQKGGVSGPGPLGSLVGSGRRQEPRQAWREAVARDAGSVPGVGRGWAAEL